MMRVKIYIILTAVFYFFLSQTVQLKAQISANGGSVYSIFGLGDLSYSSSSRTDGMGIMGFALPGSYNNTLDPAAWTKVPFTTFSTSFNFQRTNSTDGINTATRTYGGFEGFNLLIPIVKQHGLALGIGMNNYSKVNYDIKLPGESLGEPYTQYYSGVGGLTRINFGLSYILFNYFNLGAQFNYTFGEIQKITQIVFNNTALFSTHNVLSNSLSGIYINSGLIFNGFGELFKSKKLDNLNVGIYYSSPAKLNSSITATYSKSTNLDSVDITDGVINVPQYLGFGISNTFPNNLLVAADVYFQQWSNYKYYGSHPDEIQNSTRVGLGIEYTPSVKLEDPLIKRISYRIGGNYTQDYLRINGQSINEMGVSAGFTLPLSRINNADILLSYLIRGKTADGLVKDKVFKAGLTVNIGELWFLKPKGD
jgi:hypothetical protein